MTILTGTIGNDLLQGLEGNDTLYGFDGSDTLDGGSGNDILYGGDDFWELMQGGYALLEDLPSGGSDLLLGGAGDDALYGGNSTDTLDGGAGNDFLQGNAGSDTYLFGRGAGQDMIVEAGGQLGNVDVIRMAADVLPGDVTLVRDGESLVLRIDGTSDTLTMRQWFSYEPYRVEQVQFADGTTIKLSDLQFGTAGNDTLSGAAGDSVLMGYDGNDMLLGNGGNDFLNGSAGNDTLDGGIGIDTLLGGTGDDTYVVENVNDVLIANVNEGIDTVQSSVSHALGANFENLTLTGWAAINGTGNAFDNILLGNSAANVLDGGAGADSMAGGAGNDTYVLDNAGDSVTEASSQGTDTVLSAVSYTLAANVENLTLTGTDAIDGVGNVLNNVLTGNNAANLLDGGAGNDILIGGGGDDTYLFGRGAGQDVVIDGDATFGNVDTVQLAAGVTTDDVTLVRQQDDLLLTIWDTGDRLTLSGYFTDNGTSPQNVEKIQFADGTIWDWAAVNTTIVLNGTDGDDQLTGTNWSTVFNGLAGNDTLKGGHGNDTLNGGAGNDVLNGGGGADSMLGGIGNDFYFADHDGDMAVEAAGEGSDTVSSGVRYTLGDNVENLILTGAAAINGSGNALDNVITGNSAANVLDGGLGADNMTGGAGDDVYIVDNLGGQLGGKGKKVRSPGDVVTEAANEGIDAVQSSVTYTLGANVENLTLTGGAAIDGTGNALNNVLTGNSVANLLDGAIGADTLAGGAGNDLYVVDNAGDIVVENSNEGVDSVQSSVSHSLSANVENLTLTGTAAINGSGNALRNTLTGNNAANLLDGRTGADSMAGGAGNDLYMVDNVGDAVIENAGAGVDTVQSSVSYALGANVENLTLLGKAAINGSGNALNNILAGNSAANVLDGGSGADSMAGGAGDDTYVVDNASDRVTEALSEGNDTVQSALSYMLGANVENLSLTGTAVINGTGNALDNVLTGNSAANILDGGAGNDTLSGGAGDDTYLFGRGAGHDVVVDRDATVGNADTVRLAAGVSTADVTLARDENDLLLTILDTGDRLTLSNYFADNGAGPQDIAKIQFTDGTVWDWNFVHANAVNITVSLVVDGTMVNDRLFASDKSTLLNGLEGNDDLYGGSGNDTLDGGAGDDELDGGAGNNTYLFGRGSGNDEIENSSDTTTAHYDVVLFGADVTAADIDVSRDRNSLYLTIRDTGDRLELYDYFYWGSDGIPPTKIDEIRFADGTSWDGRTLEARLPVPVASEGGDLLFGNITQLSINGLGGDDTIRGADAADEILNGGAGNDHIDGHSGDDILGGGAGDDVLDGGAGSDIYLFGRGDGHDQIYFSGPRIGMRDVVRFAAGVTAADIDVSRNGDDLQLTIRDTGDSINISYYFESDITGTPRNIAEIQFADGTVWGTDAVNAKVAPTGTAGRDQLYGFATADSISGSGGDDQLVGRGGDDTLNGGAGDDYLYGGEGNDTYLFGRGDGHDTIGMGDEQPANGDVVRFAAGVAAADISVSRNGESLQLKIRDTADSLTIEGYFDADGISTSRRIAEIQFADGTVWDGDAVDAKVAPTGTEGSDQLYGFATADSISGSGGDDQLYGRGGDDTLDGGTGDDYLYGGGGDDTYLFGRGDGHDQIAYAWDEQPGMGDVVRFAAGVSAADIDVSRNGDSLQLMIRDTADSLTIQGYFDGDTTNTSRRIADIQFADGTVWNGDAVNAKVAPTGTEGSDQLYGFATADSISGSGGDDQIEGRFGADALDGGTGDDSLYGGDGNDTLDGGTGNDYLKGGSGNDVYLFGRDSGQDRIFEENWVYLDNGSTRFDDDNMILMGANVLPDDVIIMRQADDLVLSIAGTTDTLTVSEWFYPNNRVNQVQFADGTVWDAGFLAQAPVAPVVGTEQSEYLDGGYGNDLLQGLGGYDNLSGGRGNDTLEGGAGDDYLHGDEGNDTYLFGRGDGHDQISSWDDGAAKQDVIRFAADVAAADIDVSRNYDELHLTIRDTGDILTVSGHFSEAQEDWQDWQQGASPNSIEEIQFADGTVWDWSAVKAKLQPIGTEGSDQLFGFESSDAINGLGGNDYILGYSGDDVLQGGADDDYLSGGDGNDTYLFGRGDGHDQIDASDDTVGKRDVIGFAADVTAADIDVSRDYDNLKLTIRDTGDSVVVSNYFVNDGANSYSIEEIQFADGTVWDWNAIKAKAQPIGTEGDDRLIGFNTDDSINGLGGGDYLEGRGGNDMLSGGEGDDNLNGGDGNDTYLFGRGDGHDQIYTPDYYYTVGKQDVIRFAAGVAAADIDVSRDYDNLKLTIRDTGDSVGVSGYFVNDGASPYSIEEIQFADGTVWDWNAVKARAQPIGTEGDDRLIGFNTADSINGLGGVDNIDGRGGNDVLSGGEGDDYLDGGAGNDTLNGGAGNDSFSDSSGGSDTYLFGLGDGQDRVYDYGYGSAEDNTDQVIFGAGIGADQLWFREVNNNLEIGIIGTTDTMTIQNWNYHSVYHIEQFKTADGKVLLDTDVENLVSAMSAFAVPLVGQTTLPAEYAALSPVIASSWH